MRSGSRVGRYELVRPLGRGAAGEVWEAVLHGPEGFRRAVALKLLPGVEEEAWREVAREARLGALVSHPNVVATHEVGRDRGVGYLAMDLVRGPTLLAVLARAPLPLGVVLDIGLQLGAGLGHLHRLRADGLPDGLVHRDVKPANVLVDVSGTARLADLGIAQPSGRFAFGAGTLGYAAPEQLLGQGDARVDQFALGVLLYVAATRVLPFGRGEEAARRVVDADDHVARDEFAARLGPAAPLLPVLVRCLRRAPDERYPEIAGLTRALLAVAQTAGRGRLADVLDGEMESIPPLPTGSSSSPTRIRAPGNLTRGRRFTGRAAERERLAALLARSPVVTLTGLGGIGKTALAVETAARDPQAWPGGAWFAALEPATTADQVASVVAAALGFAAGPSPVRQVGEALGRRERLLLVLDNAEHVVAGVVEALAVWRAAAPEATFLVTSRVPLDAVGEVVVPLGALSGPDARQLLVDSLDEDVPPDTLDALLGALDGIPLALVLAAGRARTLGAAGLARILELRLLSGGAARDPERHRSVASALDGTFRALPDPVRHAIGELAAFPDGFSLEDAEAVVDLGAFPDPPWVLDVLGLLVTHGLLRRGSDGRFRMLPLVRSFASGANTAAAEIRVLARIAATGERRGIPELEGAVRRSLALGGPHAAALVMRWRRALGRTGQQLACADVVEALLRCDLPRAELALLRCELVAARLDADPPERLFPEVDRAHRDAGEDPYALGRTWLTRADVSSRAGANRDVRDQVRLALDCFFRAGPEASTWYHLARVVLDLRFDDAPFEVARRRAEQARAFAEHHGDDHLLARVLLHYAASLGRRALFDEAASLEEAAVRVAQASGDDLVLHAVRLNECDRLRGALRPDDLRETALRYAAAAGRDGLRSKESYYLGYARRAETVLDRDPAVVERIRALLPSVHGPTMVSGLWWDLVSFLAGTGRFREAEETLAEGADAMLGGVQSLAHAQISALRGDLDGAWATLGRAAPRLSPIHLNVLASLRVELAAWRGDLATARATLANWSPEATAYGRWCKGSAELAVLLAEGDHAALATAARELLVPFVHPRQHPFRIEISVMLAIAEALRGETAVREIDAVRREARAYGPGEREATLHALRALALARTAPEVAAAHLARANPVTWLCARYVEGARRVLSGRPFLPIR